MKISKLIQALVGLLIMGAALYIFLNGTDPKSLLNQLSSISPQKIVLGCVLAVLSIFFRAIRWKYLLPDKPNTDKKNLFAFVSIGFMVNNLVPARIGEAVRAFLLWTRNGYSATTSLGSLVVERLIDTVTYGTFFVIPAFLLPQLAGVRSVAYLISGGIAGFVLFLILYRYQSKRINFLAGRLIYLAPSRFRPKLALIGTEISSTLEWLFSARRVTGVLIFTILTSLCYPLVMIVIIEPSPNFGMISALFLQATAAIGSAIPLSPGYVGTLHAVLLQGMSYLGIEGDRARAIAIIYHAINYIPVTIVGIWYFFKVKLSLNDVREAKSRLQETSS